MYSAFTRIFTGIPVSFFSRTAVHYYFAGSDFLFNVAETANLANWRRSGTTITGRTDKTTHNTRKLTEELDMDRRK